ncbi:Low-density lipoprotein (LDL) receptor class A repeat [Trinorchestia longiramus]|nr:Low-density lipoprotein (LDL) receptor class A repeat [Trinorchestia longiramus]
MPHLLPGFLLPVLEPHGSCAPAFGLSTFPSRSLVVEFQQDRVASTESLLWWTGPPLPPQTLLTTCARFLITQGRDLYPIVSYATPTYDNEFLITFSYRKQTMKFACCNGRVVLELGVNITLYKWYSVCLTVHLRAGTYSFWLNGDHDQGLLPYTGMLSELSVVGGGMLVVGQEQDTFGGGHNAEQSMAGLLADFRMYNTTVEPSLCLAFTLCLEDAVPNQVFLDLHSLNATLGASNVNVGFVEVDTNLCALSLTYDIVFPELWTFREASDLCFAMGGTVALPKSEFENKELLKLAFQFADSCPTLKTDFLWLGFEHLYETQTLVHYLTKSKLTYDKVDSSKVALRGVEDSCGTFNGDPKDMSIWFGIWQTSDCLETRCSVCHFEQFTLITLRGLCDKSYFDNKFFASMDVNGTFEYVGEYYSVIRLVLGGKKSTFGYWKLIRLDQPTVFATMERSSMDHYPTGLNNWTVHHDICDGEVVELKLTVCERGEFTCNNGACIPLFLRCNNERECPDGTDEVDCNPLIFPPFFYESVAPVIQNGSKKFLHIYFNIEILSIKSVDLSAFQFTTELVTSMQWHDGRLHFRNLNMKDKVTRLEMDTSSRSVWRPRVSFKGAEGTACDVTHRSSELFVLRKSGPTPNSMDSVLEGEVQPPSGAGGAQKIRHARGDLT